MKKREHRPKPVSRKLADLIGIVNLVPLNMKVPYLWATAVERGIDLDVAENQLGILKASLEGLPEGFQRYILKGLVNSNNDPFFDIADAFTNAIERYEMFCSARNVLRQIAEAAMDESTKQSIHIVYKPESANVIQTREDGRLSVSRARDNVEEALEDVEPERIRICPICWNIFWAGYITQKCCTPKCANTFRVHRHRYKTDEEKNEYKFRRMKRDKKRRVQGKSKRLITERGKAT